VAFLRKALARLGVHHIFEQEEFFVEMVEACPFVVFVRFKAIVLDGWCVRVINHRAFVATVREAARDTDSAKGVESVGVLDAFAFKRGYCIRNVGTFKGDMFNDVADMVRDFVRNGK